MSKQARRQLYIDYFSCWFDREIYPELRHNKLRLSNSRIQKIKNFFLFFVKIKSKKIQ